MKFYIPKSISSDIRKKLGSVKVKKIKVITHPNSIKDECLENVRSYIDSHKGEVQFGWNFSLLGNVILRLIAHAVVKKENNDLICISPNNDLKEINFLPDNSIKNMIEGKYLPGKHLSLINNKNVQEYALLLDKAEKLKFEILPENIQAERDKINAKASFYLPTVYSESIKTTKMDECCYCGSGVLRAFCHK
ncbi:hypothetical protein H4J58_03655 [Colwellia sp. MB3u-70]|uniref:hypothetical protein n=1 Tax=unclassified Colwellia TaxID=196834 RepID=UPI0015F48CE4|nr:MULTISPECIES: hypothetical protein [unclassified Colwellia]MBA6290771.1 hypothetical protein [Colwellia sp. MB3u-8]MBA6306223.1 hypothetical protein [Colwellia sp. MB3u-70]